ncbi:MAG: sigma 54-interacting transcriptional regulator [Spirochaetaceae bacterium]
MAHALSGTVFLDDIGDLAPKSQIKLLQLLERRDYYPLGSDLSRRTDARFVVATNRDIAAVDSLLAEALRRSDGNQAAAARLLGISPQALSKRLKQRSRTGEP